MSTFQNTEKLLQVLQSFLQPDFSVSTTTYLDLLLTKLTSEIKAGNQEISEILQSWLITAFNTWTENSKPCQSLVTFTTKLIGILSENEAIFFHFHQNEVMNKASRLFQFQRQDSSASVKMAFTAMCVKLVEHPSGRQWIVSTGAWQTILSWAQANCTMFINKESQMFLSILLMKESYNQILCREIILAITKPLVDVTHNPQDNNTQFILNKQLLVDQHNLLSSTLELLYAILEYTVFIDLVNPVPNMFEDFIGLDNRVKILFEVTISTPFVKILEKLATLCAFASLRKSLKTSDVIDEKMFEGFCTSLCYISSMLISKKFILDLVLTKKLGIIFWHKLNKLKKVEPPHPYKFEIQALTLMILPLCVTVKPKHMREHCSFEDFVEKLFALTCQPIQRIAYNMRGILLKNEIPMETLCKSIVEYMLEIADILDRDAAVICFQTMCYVLKNFVIESKINVTGEKKEDDPEEIFHSKNNSYHKKKLEIKHFLDGDPINDKPHLLAALLHGVNVFTEKFKLKWSECVETICVLAIAQEILNHPGVESKTCILALKTCKLAIENFMPPNLVLLSELDNQTKEIGATLFKRIHDTNWDVQDSVLEVLITVTNLCEHKYPPYQALLLKNQFLQVATELVKAENETYVRASALKLLSTAVKINVLWEKQLCQLNLPDLAMKIVYEENEAVVRREAVVLINNLYKYRNWQKPVISTMVQAMTAAAVLDLDWEVKINALEFWRYFIQSHLTDQGMLDGEFPNVTFSKEHRKIVSLNETEVKQRLNKALDELARQRCLGVLLVTLKDESDLEVAKTSAKIIADLRKILINYKINEPTPEPPSPKDSATIDTNYVRKPSTNNSLNDEKPKDVFNVIKEIVDADDEKLLASIYSESMRMDGDETDRSRKDNFEFVGRIQRQEFLREIVNFDLEGYIQQRTEWLQNYTTSFDSIMDDILMIAKGDVNMIDCY